MVMCPKIALFCGVQIVDWLWWGETDVSELRPLRAYCSSPGDLRCGPSQDDIDGMDDIDWG
jgi:hypothetical protein